MAYKTPGVYIVEKPGPKTLQPVGTDVAAFVGQAPDSGARLGEAVPVNNWSEFCKFFAPKGATGGKYLANAVYGFFMNKGSRCFIVNIPDSEAIAGGEQPRTGLKLLEAKDEVSIVAAPGRTDVSSHVALQAHCELMGDRMYIADPPDVDNTELLKSVEQAQAPVKPKDKDKDKDASATTAAPPPEARGARPATSLNGFGATYFPWLIVNDVFTNKEIEVPPSGHIAGIYSASMAHRAPANKTVLGAIGLTYEVTGPEQGDLNSHGINCIRHFSNEGILVWGARTLAEESSEWRYVPVRRLLIMIEQTILRNTSFAVFEPNDEKLWRTLRSAVTGFLRNVYRDGALMGKTPEEAFFVKCDSETNPQESIDLGQVVTVIGVAPVKPAEFIVFQIGQTASGATIESL